ncbi:MAG: TetR/AcrR family transcriptional regulator [Peptococcaceae bacterium]|jgi:AcrR family transcriptional regulator|nr:TetR/AcrR family transcriptional regulator [Peptococcaceae bacterium]MDH7523962.1 TetR/AcrR family transcriptional regulator [Peptococcaceae bacterium]
MKERIIQHAGEEIGRYGFRKFTIDGIAEAMGISKKTVYKFFKGKREIVSAVVDDYIKSERAATIEAFQDRKSKSWLDRLNAVFFLYSEYKIPLWLLGELQRFFPEEWAKVEEFRRFKKELVYSLLEQGAKTGEINSCLHPDVITSVLDKSLDNLLDLNFLQKHEMTAHQLVEQVRDIFVFGILARTGGGA